MITNSSRISLSLDVSSLIVKYLSKKLIAYKNSHDFNDTAGPVINEL